MIHLSIFFTLINEYWYIHVLNWGKATSWLKPVVSNYHFWTENWEQILCFKIVILQRRLPFVLYYGDFTYATQNDNDYNSFLLSTKHASHLPNPLNSQNLKSKLNKYISCMIKSRESLSTKLISNKDQNLCSYYENKSTPYVCNPQHVNKNTWCN